VHQGPSPIANWSPQVTLLLRYVFEYWEIHARGGVTGNVRRLALRLLNWKLRHTDFTGSTGIHGAGYLGIVETAVTLLQMR